MKRELLDALRAARRARRPVALLTDLASGDQWLLEPGAAAPAEIGEEIRAAALVALAEDRSSLLPVAGRELFANVFPAPLRMIVVGAVHIAQPLARIAELAGFEVIVVDPRDAWASEARFPDTALRREWPGESVEALAPDARTAVVTLSHDPKLDDPALAAALRSDAYYIGALGSRRTHAKRLERLRRAGFDETQRARIRGPVGLPIGARSPAEIAVSIVAEAVEQLRRAR